MQDGSYVWQRHRRPPHACRSNSASCWPGAFWSHFDAKILITLHYFLQNYRIKRSLWIQWAQSRSNVDTDWQICVLFCLNINECLCPSVSPQSCWMISLRVVSVWTAGRCLLLCGGETGRVITCVTLAVSITRWTGSTGRSSNPRDDWCVSLTTQCLSSSRLNTM